MSGAINKKKALLERLFKLKLGAIVTCTTCPPQLERTSEVSSPAAKDKNVKLPRACDCRTWKMEISNALTQLFVCQYLRISNLYISLLGTQWDHLYCCDTNNSCDWMNVGIFENIISEFYNDIDKEIVFNVDQSCHGRHPFYLIGSLTNRSRCMRLGHQCIL